LLERYSFAQQLEWAGYNIIQSSLSYDDPPIAIVDISELKNEVIEIGGEPYEVPPRHALKEIIDAAAKHKPKAIGIDIDFSMEKREYAAPDDPAFFKFCLDEAQKEGVPIFLGIKNSEGRDPDYWLVSKEFKDLAADISIPKEDRKKMPKVISYESTGRKGDTMAYALAKAYGIQESRLPEWLHSFLEPFSLKSLTARKDAAKGTQVEEFYVDYSPLRELLNENRSRNLKLKADEARDVTKQGDFLKDKIVLIGNATSGETLDAFTVLVPYNAVPGVCIHACAAYTLASAQLYELTTPGRLALDYLLSFVVFLAIAVIRYYYQNRTTKRVATHRLQRLFTAIVVTIALIFAVFLVRFTHIVWEDFILVLVALSLHPSLEHYLVGFWRFIKRNFRPAAETLVFEGDEEEHQ
jgi:CHASE2 domain-containing sensor protein